MPPIKPMDLNRGISPAMIERDRRRINGTNGSGRIGSANRATGPVRENEIRNFRHELELRMRECEFTTAFYMRYPQQLERAYHTVGIPRSITPNGFMDNVLSGARTFGARYFEDAYRLINIVDFKSSDLAMLYFLGRIYARAPKLHPATVDAAERIAFQGLSRPGLLEIFMSGRNFTCFISALDIMISSARSLRTDRELRQAIETAAKSINQEVADIFRLAEVKRERVTRIEEQPGTVLKEDQIRLLNTLIEIGETIEAVKESIQSENSAELARTIIKAIYRDNDLIREMKSEMIAAACRAEPELALNMLTEAVIDIQISHVTRSEAAQAMEMIREVTLRLEHDKPAKFTAGLVTQLIDSFRHETSLAVEHQMFVVKYDFIKSILLRSPEAIPALLAERTKHVSPIKNALAWFLNLIGIETRDVVVEVLDPLINELTQNPLGQDQVLNYAYEALKNDGVISRPFAGQLDALQVPRKVLARTMRRILAQAEINPLAAFEPKTRTEGLREAVTDLARVNKINSRSWKLSRSLVGRTLLALSAKIQQFTDMAKEKNSSGMGLLNDELKDVSAEAAAALNIPHVDLISNYSETSYLDIMAKELRQARAKVIPTNPLDYQIVKTTKGSIPAARRVKQVIDSNPGVRKAIETLMVSEQFEAEQHRVDHAIRYAYCFLAPKQGIPEKEITRDLESTLAEDANRDHLYLALKVLPDVVKSEMHQRSDQALFQLVDLEPDRLK